MKKMMPWMVAILVLAIGPAAYAADQKIAHINLMQVLQTYQQGDPAAIRLREEIERKQKEFDIKRAEVREMREKFEAQESTLSEEERAKQHQVITGKATELISVLSEAQQEMKSKEEFLATTLIEKVRLVIQEFGEKNGYHYILDGAQRSVLFADNSLDVTEAIIKELTAER
jgi:Skp family chaperone for outer membrane proteins